MPNPWADAAAAFAQLAELAAPPVVPNGALILDWEQQANLYNGTGIGTENFWTQWAPPQTFEVVGQFALIPVLFIVNMAGEAACGASCHSEGAFRLNVDDLYLKRISGWVWGLRGAQLTGNYAQLDGGCALLLLPPGPHSVKLEAYSYYLDTVFYLRPATYAFEFLGIQALQFGS